jgi:hypothetical protein
MVASGEFTEYSKFSEISGSRGDELADACFVACSAVWAARLYNSAVRGGAQDSRVSEMYFLRIL